MMRCLIENENREELTLYEYCIIDYLDILISD